MARTVRKPAAEKSAALPDTTPEAGGAEASAIAETPVKPAEDPTPPDGDGQVIAQTPANDAPASVEANQQPGDGAPPAVSGPIVRVRTQGRKPRRRAGRAFGREPVEIAVAALSDNEIAALLGDPVLVIEFVEID